MNLYGKIVADDAAKQPTFLAVLRHLRPAIRGEERLRPWWRMLIRPAVEGLAHDDDLVPATRELLLGLLIYEDDEDRDGERALVSALFAQEILDMYLEKTSIPGVDHEGTLVLDETATAVGAHLESVLVDFGRKKPRVSRERFLLAHRPWSPIPPPGGLRPLTEGPTQNLMTYIDTLLEIKEHRRQALSLLCTFVRYQPPHLYLVVQTPLVDHLLQCLMIDTSTTVISLALLSLVMFLPHIPGSLVHYLPRLFIVYSRLLCWDRLHGARRRQDGTGDAHDAAVETDDPSDPSSGNLWTYTEPSWDKLHTSFDAADATIPDLTHYFSFLYGLYPENFMGFIRKPNRYLRNARFPALDRLDLDQDAIRQLSERYRQIHLLHPNFYNITVEAELSDLSRFLKSEPSDIVAQCMELCMAVPAALQAAEGQADVGGEPTGLAQEAYVETDDIPGQSLLSMDDDHDEDDEAPTAATPTRGRPPPPRTSSRRASIPSGPSTSTSVTRAIESMAGTMEALPGNSSSSYAGSRMSTEFLRDTPAAQDSPTLPAHLVSSPPESKLREMLQTQDFLRSIVSRSQADETTAVGGSGPRAASPRLEAYMSSLTHMPDRSPIIRPISADSRRDIALLQREVLLLRNDLNFERFLKQQHLSHIGQLQRKYIRDASAEADAQNLIQSNRALKVKADEAKRAYATLKKETAASRNHAKKWEGELNAKTRALREQQKRWEVEEQHLRRELSDARDEANRLRGLLVESEAKELVSRQKLDALELSVDELEKLRQEVEQLDQRLRDYEAREEEFDRARRDEGKAYTQLETARLRLQGRDAEREKMRRAFEQRIAELESRLRSHPTSPSQSPQSLQAMIDAALASSRSRFDNLKKVHHRLLSRHAELEIAYLDLQAAAELGGSINGRPNGVRRGPLEFDLFNDVDRLPTTMDAYHATPGDRLGSAHDDLIGRGHNGSHVDHLSSSAPDHSTHLASLQGRIGGLGLQEIGPASAQTNDSEAFPSPRGKKHSSADGVTISNGSVRSAARSTNSGSQDGKKQKIKPNSGVRVYGRGGSAFFLSFFHASFWLGD